MDGHKLQDELKFRLRLQCIFTRIRLASSGEGPKRCKNIGARHSLLFKALFQKPRPTAPFLDGLTCAPPFYLPQLKVPRGIPDTIRLVVIITLAVKLFICRPKR